MARQLPEHDQDPSMCHELSPAEVKQMEQYVRKYKDEALGIGDVRLPEEMPLVRAAGQGGPVAGAGTVAGAGAAGNTPGFGGAGAAVGPMGGAGGAGLMSGPGTEAYPGGAMGTAARAGAMGVPGAPQAGQTYVSKYLLHSPNNVGDKHSILCVPSDNNNFFFGDSS